MAQAKTVQVVQTGVVLEHDTCAQGESGHSIALSDHRPVIADVCFRAQPPIDPTQAAPAAAAPPAN